MVKNVKSHFGCELLVELTVHFYYALFFYSLKKSNVHFPSSAELEIAPSCLFVIEIFLLSAFCDH